MFRAGQDEVQSPATLQLDEPLLYTPMEVGVILCADPEHLSTDKPKLFIDLDEDACCASVARTELFAQGVADELGLGEAKFTILTKRGRTLTAKQEALKKVRDIVEVRDDGTLVLLLHVPPADYGFHGSGAPNPGVTTYGFHGDSSHSKGALKGEGGGESGEEGGDDGGGGDRVVKEDLSAMFGEMNLPYG